MEVLVGPNTVSCYVNSLNHYTNDSCLFTVKLPTRPEKDFEYSLYNLRKDPCFFSGGDLMRTMRNLLAKKAVVTVLAVGISLAAVNAFWGGSDSALSQLGSSGSEVRAIQERLKERGLFNDSVTGYYGEKTKAAVIKFQKQQGISQTGTAGPQTLRALGISIGSVPSATEQNINLLARIISAEARGEPYVGQVAVGAVILNRIEHPSFPDTLSGVIYQNGAFTAVVDGQFNEPVAASAYNAARDALNGWDPTNGCVYYYNPAKTSNAYMHAKPTVTVIGSHRFCM